MFQDIHDDLYKHRLRGRIDYFPYNEILYADDTFLIFNDTRAANRFLKQLEIESLRYNMTLNETKCFFVDMNMTITAKPKVNFADGTPMNSIDKVTYLGGTITQNAYPQNEIRKRMGIALQTSKKLMLFWDKTNASASWKLQVYNAVIIAQLRYSLDSTFISETMARRMDAIHIAGLRRILKIDNAYISRISHEEVLRRANVANMYKKTEGPEPD